MSSVLDRSNCCKFFMFIFDKIYPFGNMKCYKVVLVVVMMVVIMVMVGSDAVL